VVALFAARVAPADMVRGAGRPMLPVSNMRLLSWRHTGYPDPGGTAAPGLHTKAAFAVEKVCLSSDTAFENRQEDREQ
jgi:hypothetical protein